MQWLRSHPYVVSLIMAAVLLVLGVFIVTQRTDVSPRVGELRVWSGIGAGLSDPSSGALNQIAGNREDLYTEVVSGPPFYFAASEAQFLAPSRGISDDFDFENLLADLAHPSGSLGAQDTSDSADAYSFIPSGLLSTSTLYTRRSGKQQALFSYGNEIASDIESHEERYRNAAQILKDQFEDRDDEVKTGALLQLAASLSRVGDSLLGMEEVPPEAKTAHERLARSYKEMGTTLARIPESSDQALLDTILAYNASVEMFSKDYIALVTLFSAYGVTFSEDDPGRIFVFTNLSSL